MESSSEPFADLFRVALEDDVEVAAEPSDHRSDVAYRVRGHVVGDRLADVLTVTSWHPGTAIGVEWIHASSGVRSSVRSRLRRTSNVGDGLGAGLAGERRGRQAHHADELGFSREVGAHGLGAFVERVPAGQQHGDAAGAAARPTEAFDEVVVQGRRMPPSVVR